MEKMLIETSVFIKNRLGLCNTKGCYRKAVEEIEIECINIKRCLCKKHLEQYKELTKKYYIGIDMASEEDRTFISKVLVSTNEAVLVAVNEVKQEKNKSEYEKQLDKLYKLLKRVRKDRVKKKINKRISKLKGDEKCGKHRRDS